MAERADTDTIQGSSPVEKIDQDIHTCIGLRVNVEHRLWKGLEKIGKKGNWLAIVDESPGHLLSRHVGDVSIDTTRAQQIRIVKCDEMPVIRDLDVRLEIPEADADSGIERGKRVLRKVLESTTMCERDERIVDVRFEKRMLVSELHDGELLRSSMSLRRFHRELRKSMKVR